jgi:hypothetical protein
MSGCAARAGILVSWPCCSCRRSLAHGLHSHAAQSEDRNHHRVPQRGPGLLRAAHRRTRAAHRQRVKLSIQPVPSGLPEARVQTPPHKAIYAQNQWQGRTVYPHSLREWAYAKYWTDSQDRDLHRIPWTHYYIHQRPHGSLDYKPPISRSEVVIAS